MPDRLDATKLTEKQKASLRDANACLLDPPRLDEAIVDVGEDGHAIYDYWGLVFVFCEMDGMTEEDAVEWVEYNTLRALPYMPKPRPEVRTE